MSTNKELFIVSIDSTKAVLRETLGFLQEVEDLRVEFRIGGFLIGLRRV